MGSRPRASRRVLPVQKNGGEGASKPEIRLHGWRRARRERLRLSPQHCAQRAPELGKQRPREKPLQVCPACVRGPVGWSSRAPVTHAQLLTKREPWQHLTRKEDALGAKPEAARHCHPRLVGTKASPNSPAACSRCPGSQKTLSPGSPLPGLRSPSSGERGGPPESSGRPPPSL